MASTYVHTVAALAHALAGDGPAALTQAQALIDGLDDERSSGRRAIWLNHYLHMRLRVAAILDDGTTQRAMHERLCAGFDARERPVFVRQRAALPARMAALEGRWREAAAGFEAALADEVALDHYGQAGELRARWAAALVHCGQVDEAAAALRPALARAFAGGELAPLLFAGRAALATLAGVAWGARLAPHAQQWLRERAVQPLPAGTADRTVRADAATDGARGAGLSAREIEVLARMTEGDSNKLIARALGLSPHTVKRHVANILDKLALGSRLEAARWWRGQPR